MIKQRRRDDIGYDLNQSIVRKGVSDFETSIYDQVFFMRGISNAAACRSLALPALAVWRREEGGLGDTGCGI
jgi:hypothetical protein